MKYFDPHKFDDLPEEPTEQELLELDARMGHDYGTNNCYDGSPPKLSKEERAWLKQYWSPKREYDDLDVQLGLVRQSVVDAIVGFIDQTPPIKDCEAAEFTWRWQTVSNATNQSGERDRIRVGKLWTRTQTFALWGFESWQEFNSHLHISDKELAREYHERTKLAIATSSSYVGQYSTCYWLAKDKEITKPGFWAITIDEYTPPGRHMSIYSNGEMMFKENLSMIAKNSVSVKTKGE